MRKVLLILLLISLPGCQPGKESPARSTALREVKRLIDQDSFPAKYIIMYEEPSNDIGSIYKITPAHTDIGRKLLMKFAEDCAEVAVMDKEPKLDGRHMNMFLSPKVSKDATK